MESLSHTRWECKYHVVFIPEYRKKAIFGQIRRALGEVFRRLARQRESVNEEGHLMPDRVHMMSSIPPKYAVSQVIGFLKGKSAIHIARRYAGRKRNFVGRHFWSRGYFASTVGRDKQGIRDHIQTPGSGRPANRPVELDVVASLGGSRSRLRLRNRPL
jgi:putative transposase